MPIPRKTTSAGSRMRVAASDAATPVASSRPAIRMRSASWCIGLRLDQPGADGVPGELDPVSEVELVEQVGAMTVDGARADDEHLGDLTGGVALGDECQDLRLPPGELGE